MALTLCVLISIVVHSIIFIKENTMIYILDYDAGNLTSVKRACDYLGLKAKITSDWKEVEKAGHIIFPGVGNASQAMATLKERYLDRALAAAFQKGTPILGICVGAQIILSFSEEENTKGLDLIPGKCIRFNLSNRDLKIPHMGWNRVKLKKDHFILKDFKNETQMYFVHSYYPLPDDPENIYAECEYEISFPVVIGRKNLVASQFHLEKSGRHGLDILKKFCEWDGKQC